MSDEFQLKHMEVEMCYMLSLKILTKKKTYIFSHHHMLPLFHQFCLKLLRFCGQISSLLCVYLFCLQKIFFLLRFSTSKSYLFFENAVWDFYRKMLIFEFFKYWKMFADFMNNQRQIWVDPGVDRLARWEKVMKDTSLIYSR